MKRIIDLVFAGGLILILTGAFQKAEKPDSIFYFSLNKAIQLGQYDGMLQLNDLMQHGDFGIGTEEKLKSELVILDGVVYGVMADGNSKILPNHTQIPFAATKFFVPDTNFTITQKVSFKELKQLLDSVLAPSSFAAIKVTAKFPMVEYRSFYKQEKPYKPLKEVLFNKFKRRGIEGVLVGFFTPRSLEALNSPSYHFHFIDDAKTTGGHLLDAEMEQLEVQIDFSQDVHIELPERRKILVVNFNTQI